MIRCILGITLILEPPGKASKRIHEAGYHNFKWKRSFHDRIIRDDELEIKRRYIKNNPLKW